MMLLAGIQKEYASRQGINVIFIFITKPFSVCFNKCLETSHYLSKEQRAECMQMTATWTSETAGREKMLKKNEDIKAIPNSFM